MPEGQESPADAAGRIALERMFTCLDEGRSFRLEAGAGAGKTYSLEKALRRLIEKRGTTLLCSASTSLSGGDNHLGRFGADGVGVD